MDFVVDNVSLFWIKWTSLTWWQMGLWIVWLIYFLGRTYHYWCEADERGFLKGYRKAAFGTDTHVRLWHILRMLIDIPSAICGLFLPFIRDALTMKICELKDDKPKGKEYSNRQETL
jgi:hypothetical protein